jgi:hypothetical protein
MLSQVSQATKDSVDLLNRRLDDQERRQDNRERRQERQLTLDWLTPIDYAPQQTDFISRQ